MIIQNYNFYNKVYNLNYDALKKDQPKVFKILYRFFKNYLT